MMSTKPSTRRAALRRMRHGLPIILGLFVGLVAGVGLASAYPPPSVDMIKVQVASWYQHMRQLIAPDDQTGTRVWVGEPQIYAQAPIALPPPADSTDELVDDDVANLLNVKAPAPDAPQLNAALDDTMNSLGLQHRMLVVDAATGETLYDRGGDDAIVPASTLKLYTAVNVLHHLDPDHRFTTTAQYAPVHGLSLVGGGDGLLALGESTGSTVGYAGLADLAQTTWDTIGDELVAAGQTTVTVHVDVSRYDTPWIHPDWSEGLQVAGWISPVYPLNTYGGLDGHPSHSNTAVKDGAAVAASAFTNHLNELAAETPIEFIYSGQAAQPADAEQVGEVRSATLGQQLEYAMKHSNNMLFEMFGREAALAAQAAPDFTGSTETTMATMTELGVQTEQLAVVDNSGLSPRSRATLNATVDLFELMLTQEQYRPLLDTLTIAGYDGTMRNRMTEAPYSGAVRTKTGTLEAASSNAGLTVTAEGRALWFAINTSGGGGDYETIRAEQDELVRDLTSCDCAVE